MFIIIPCVELVSLPPVEVALSILGNDFIMSPMLTHIIGVAITPNLVILPINDFVISDVDLAVTRCGPLIDCEVKLAAARAIVKNNTIPIECILDSHLNTI
jgi:hypothetical protein